MKQQRANRRCCIEKLNRAVEIFCNSYRIFLCYCLLFHFILSCFKTRDCWRVREVKNKMKAIITLIIMYTIMFSFVKFSNFYNYTTKIEYVDEWYCACLWYRNLYYSISNNILWERGWVDTAATEVYVILQYTDLFQN